MRIALSDMRRPAMILSASLYFIGGVPADVRAEDVALSISRTTDKLFISWPQATSNSYYLQSTLTLTPGIWTNVTREPVVLGTNLVVTLSSVGGSAFFRLQAWETLFTGAGTSAFRAYRGSGFPSNNWVVSGNELRTVPTNSANRVDLATTNTYADFELQLEWNAAVGGESGLFYGVSEVPNSARESGPEYQIIDDATDPEGATPVTSAGSLYGLLPPTNKVLNPAGQFNALRVIVLTNHVEHWLNGRRIVEYQRDSAAFQSLVAASQFGSYPLFGQVTNGNIVLQHADGTVAFRNIRIRRLVP